MVANLWLRPGNSHSANNVQAFLDSTLEKLNGKQVGLLRADSGFGDNSFLDDLEKRQMHHVVALRLNPSPCSGCWWSSGAGGWWLLDEGIKLVSFAYRAPGWTHARRVAGIRQHVKRKEAKGKTLSLFADDPLMGQYRFAALVTDLTLPGQEVWRLCRGRADCENRIKELKYDFAADSFCLRDFWATEAALSMVMMAYNLMSLFRQATLRASVIQSGSRDVRHTLKTLRYKLFAKAGFITTEGRTRILKLAVAMRQRQWMEAFGIV